MSRSVQGTDRFIFYYNFMRCSGINSTGIKDSVKDNKRQMCGQVRKWLSGGTLRDVMFATQFLYLCAICFFFALFTLSPQGAKFVIVELHKRLCTFG